MQHKSSTFCSGLLTDIHGTGRTKSPPREMLHQGNNPSQSIFISWQEVCIADLCHGVESYYLLTKWFTADFRKPQKDSHASRAPKDDDSSRMLGFHPNQSQHFQWHWLHWLIHTRWRTLPSSAEIATCCGIWMCPSAQGSYCTQIPGFWGVFSFSKSFSYCGHWLIVSFSGTINSKLFFHQNSNWMESHLSLLFVSVSLFLPKTCIFSDVLQWCHQIFLSTTR